MEKNRDSMMQALKLEILHMEKTIGFQLIPFSVQAIPLSDGVKIQMPSNRNIRTDRRSIHSVMQDRPMNCMPSGRRVTDRSICTT